MDTAPVPRAAQVGAISGRSQCVHAGGRRKGKQDTIAHIPMQSSHRCCMLCHPARGMWQAATPTLSAYAQLLVPPSKPSPLGTLLTRNNLFRKLKRNPPLMTRSQSQLVITASCVDCLQRHGHALTRATWSTTNGMDAATWSPLRGSHTKATSATTWLKGEFSTRACRPLAGGPPGACSSRALTTKIMAAGLC